MKILLNKCDSDNWYTIVRAEHDGREWMERIENGGFQFMMSERLSPEACIEGPLDHMHGLAVAIKSRGSAYFKRCAVRFESDGVHFWSPKNSEHDAVIPLEFADDFAEQVFSEVAKENPPTA